ncbi:hypothetical protein BC952_3107 [Flavobacterium limicola]|uniref:Uncharacterized protein n=1 Tax=Flavobacterium limicola TaxID=180441 RepID=A0A495RSH7_9FLAO|nr:hypothetical protein BC952_3107 [Flavobacterium limicola]
MVFETESFLNKIATQLPMGTILSKNRQFQYHCTLSTTLLYLLKLSKFNLYSCFNSSSLSSTPSKQSALTVFEQKNSSGLIKWFYAVPYIVTNIPFLVSHIYKVS